MGLTFHKAHKDHKYHFIVRTQWSLSFLRNTKAEAWGNTADIIETNTIEWEIRNPIVHKSSLDMGLSTSAQSPQVKTTDEMPLTENMTKGKENTTKGKEKTSKEKEKTSHHKFPRFRFVQISAADICKLHLPRSRTELLRQLQDWTADRFAEKSI